MIYGRLATECGYRFSDIDVMEWDDIMLIFGYWQKFPPPGSLIRGIAQVLGIEFSDPVGTTKHMTEREARAMMARTGGKGFSAADMVG